MAREPLVRVFYESEVTSLARDSRGRWQATVSTPGGTLSLTPLVVIDATELGDVARMAGAAYDVGMESSSVTGEDMAPAQGSPIVQDMTYVAVLQDFGHDATIARPEGYDASLYRCSAINDSCLSPREPARMWPADKMMSYGRLPGGKYMINWPIEGNDYYSNVIDATPAERRLAYERAKRVTLGFVYFLQTELGYRHVGIARGEYPTADGLPFYPYHRESRRVRGLVRFTSQHITAPFGQAQALYRTTVAVGDYPVDQHHGRYSGAEALPDLHFHPVPSYGVPLGALLPEGVDGLIVAEKSISVSNIVNGTTRLQPVVMQIGTAAGALAALSVGLGVRPSAVPVRRVQQAVLDAGGYLLPYLDVERGDPLFLPLQRLGATGIIRGEGRTQGWSNETWVHPDRAVAVGELSRLYAYYGMAVARFPERITRRSVGDALLVIARRSGRTIHLPEGWDSGDEMTVGEFAVLVDGTLDPFGSLDVGYDGSQEKEIIIN